MSRPRSGGGLLREFFLPERGILRPGPYVVVIAIGIGIGLLLAASNQAYRLDWSIYDRYLRIASQGAAPSEDVVVVAIDEPSFREIGISWPWPRSMHASLLHTLSEAGAKTIVLDLILDQRSQDPQEDQFLTEAVREAGNVILAADWQETVDESYSVSQWINPFSELEKAAAGTGIAKLPVDPDGVIRRTTLLFQGRPVIAFAAAERQPGFEALDRPGGERLIRFDGPQRIGIKTVSYYQALNPSEFLPDGIFEGKIVLVGFSLAAETEIQNAADHYPTPLSNAMAGVEIHARILDNLLRGRFISDPFSSRVLTVLFCLALALALAPVFYRLGAFWGLFVVLGLSSVLFVGGYPLLSFGQIRIPIFPEILTCHSMYLLVSLYRFILGIMERRLILGAFKHYLAPAIVDRILTDPSQLKLGGANYEVTVVFTDLAGFTSISERMTPEALHALLTEYFQQMMEILSAENATLDKFIGDAIMVYFGCPVQDPAHPVQACRSAVRMQKRLQELNRQWSSQGIPEIKMRIGINTGSVVAGNMGTQQIFNFTILGDNVNLSSRLEGVNKEYGTRTIISQKTRGCVGDLFALRELDFIRVKGKSTPVAIYELADFSDALTSERNRVFELYAEGLAMYRGRRWHQAEEAFRAALSIDPADGPSKTLRERCLHLEGGAMPSTWDGIYEMKTK